jgi:hypothetical protein
MKNKKEYCLITPPSQQRKIRSAAFLVLLVLFVPLLKGETAVIPGDINRICDYTNFFYNFPAEDFFYYLNERLLFTDKPDGKILGSGIRNKLLGVIRWHNIIKKSLRRFKQDKNKTIAIHAADPTGIKQITIILNMLGLSIETTPEGTFRVTHNPDTGFSNYFRFMQLDTRTIENQLNKAQYFYFKLSESEVPVPWDYTFLSEVTGKKVNAASFFETMLRDEQFSLFLGVLYRLSDEEIDYIGGLIPVETFGGWKEIYKDKRFLMGMFILSDALRLIHDDIDSRSRWDLPGGNDAGAFWTKMAGKDAVESPFEFLRSVATKDDGKLNYFYLFSYFLPRENQMALFSGANASKMQEMYDAISLTDKEKLKDSQFPGLRDTGLYTILYALHMKDNEILLPNGTAIWMNAMKIKDENNPQKEETETKETMLETLKATFPTYAPSDKRKRRMLRSVRTGFYTAFYGGAEFLNGGDFDRMIDINEPFYANLDNPSLTHTVPFFRSFGIETGYNLGRFALGIETGYIFKHFNIDDPANFFQPSTGWSKYRLSALTLLANVHYTVAESSLVNLNIFAGGGLFFGKYSHSLEYSLLDTPIFQVSDERATQTAFGFQGGASLDFFLAKKIALFIEGRYRWVDLSRLAGKGNSIYKSYAFYQRKDYGGGLYFDTAPVPEFPGLAGFTLTRFPHSLTTISRARMGLDGFALTMGIKFYF